MSRLALILGFLLLSGADAAAVLLALGRIGLPEVPGIPAAIGVHLLVAVLALAAAGWYPGLRGRPGGMTTGLFAASICLLTPVLGCLVAGWLLQAMAARSAPCAEAESIRLGNPLDETTATRPAFCPFREPLTAALAHGHLPLQRLAAARLSRQSDGRALAILRALDGSGDARTHLYAQAALASAFERRERQWDQLRRALDPGAPEPPTPAACERLATALMHAAEASPGEAPALYGEAAAALDRALSLAPTDASCLARLARCLIRLGNLERVPDLYGRLCAVGGGTSLADRLELDYLAALGNWQRVSAAAERVLPDRTSSGHFGISHRDFWLGSRAALPPR